MHREFKPRRRVLETCRQDQGLGSRSPRPRRDITQTGIPRLVLLHAPSRSRATRGRPSGHLLVRVLAYGSSGRKPFSPTTVPPPEHIARSPPPLASRAGLTRLVALWSGRCENRGSLLHSASCATRSWPSSSSSRGLPKSPTSSRLPATSPASSPGSNVSISDTEPEPEFRRPWRSYVAGLRNAVRPSSFVAGTGSCSFEVASHSSLSAIALFGRATRDRRRTARRPDGRRRPLFRKSPRTSEPGFSFAAVPLWPDDTGLHPRGLDGVGELTPRSQALRALSRQVTAQLELRRRRRSEREQTGEKLILEVAGLVDREPGVTPPAKPQ